MKDKKDKKKIQILKNIIRVLHLILCKEKLLEYDNKNAREKKVDKMG